MSLSRCVPTSYMFHSTLVVCVCSVAKSHLTLLWPHGLYPARLLCPWDSPGKNTGVGCCFLLHSDPGMKLVSPALAGRFFSTEPAGKPQRSLPNACVCVCVCVCVFIHLVLVVLGLRCWVPAFSSCCEQASHCPDFSCCGARALGWRPH